MMFAIGLAVLFAAGILGGGPLTNHTSPKATEAQTVQTDPPGKEVTERSSAPGSAEKENSAREEKGVFEPATLENQGGEDVRGWKSLQCPKCQDGEDF